MCLATVYNTRQDDSIVLKYVSKIEVEGNKITLIDVMGERKRWREPLLWRILPAVW